MNKAKKITIIHVTLIVVAVLIASVVIEVVMYNRNLFHLNENYAQMKLTLDDMQLKEFALDDEGYLVAASNDPWLEIRGVSFKYINDIQFDMTYLSSDVLTVYFRHSNEGYNETNTIVKRISKGDTMMTLDCELEDIAGLRLDLATIPKSKIRFNNITINPTIPFAFSFPKFFFIFLFLIVLISYFLIKKIVVDFESTPAYIKICIICNQLLQYRYYIAFCILVFVVLFKIHGYSVGMWKNIVSDGDATSSIMLGDPRSIRGDEWFVQTPYYLSQTLNGFQLHNPHLGNQNMILAGMSPVIDWTLMGKWFNWGYILFGAEHGMAWHWITRLLLLFLSSYEIFYLLTKRDKVLAVLGACMLLFAPAVSWWMSTSLLELLIHAQLAIVAVFHYIQCSKSRWKRACFCVLFFCSGIGFVFSIYPPWQISFGYFALLILAYIIYCHKKDIKLDQYDAAMMIAGFTCLFFVIGMFYFHSSFDIQTMMNTAYPGKRISVGGGLELYNLFNYLCNWLLPYKQVNFGNACEVSSFVCFLPIVILIFYKIYKTEHNKTERFLLAALFVFILFGLAWCFVGGSVVLAKMTLLSMIPTKRFVYIILIASIYLGILLQRNITAKTFKPLYTLVICISVGLFYFIVITSSPMGDYLSVEDLIVTIAVYTSLHYLYLVGSKRTLTALMVLFLFVNSWSVNPVDRGLSVLYDTNISKEIRSIHEKDKASTWIGVNNHFYGHYLMAQGVNVFNYVQSYPDLNKWHQLDPDRVYEDLYNRYAHVPVYLTQDATQFDNPSVDVLTVKLCVDDIPKTNVKYLLSNGDISHLQSNIVKFKIIYHDKNNNMYINEAIY